MSPCKKSKKWSTPMERIMHWRYFFFLLTYFSSLRIYTRKLFQCPSYVEPFDLSNTARSVYDCVIFEQIKSVFVKSADVLERTMDLNSVFTQSFLPPPMPITASSLCLQSAISSSSVITTATTSSATINHIPPTITINHEMSKSSWGMLIFHVHLIVVIHIRCHRRLW